MQASGQQLASSLPQTFAVQQEWRDHDDGSAEISDASTPFYSHDKRVEEYPDGSAVTDKYTINESEFSWTSTDSTSVTSVGEGY